ncbi:hypothetical protein [Sphingomonas faeni]|uniref:hypothetical protein n=1 Tax=Sphingomonas faeni TaxID=185950 RepID=UPI003347E6BD
MSEMVDYDSYGRPIGPEVRVRCKLRNGQIMRPARARNRIWEYALMTDPDYQIVAYAFATPATSA